jgi:serine/threonine-protein kinase
MGAVYRAWHLNLDMPVAIKEMTPQPNLSTRMLAQLRDQFQQEAAILFRLNHPNLVRIVDFFVEGKNAYLVMDFVAGESLSDRIDRLGPLSEEEVIEWMRQLLRALAYCHHQNVIHRDIKPENIVIRSDGQAVLVDFGLVKLWDPNDPRTKTVMRGMGTPQYAPPEQYDAQPGSTVPASDVYSLGATLYHTLTGQAPPTATERMRRPSSFVAPRALNPGISPRVERVIVKAMEPQPERRYQSAQEMIQALDSRPTRSFPWRWAIGLAGALSLVVCAISAATFIPFEPGPRGTLEPTSAPSVSATSSGSSQPPTSSPTVPPQIPTSTPAATLPRVPPQVGSLGSIWVRPIDEMAMVYVPEGSFLMGSTEAEIDAVYAQCLEDFEASKCEREWYEDEAPQHRVTLDAFWLDRMEVTNAQYELCVAERICAPSPYADDEGYSGLDYPAVGVTWQDAVDYCAWLGGRLPTEAEWEYAARGPEGRQFPWGDVFDGSLLNFCDTNCFNTFAHAGYDDGYALTAPVGTYPGGESWCGALDMAGNVWEWTLDWYGDSYTAEAQTNPRGPSSGETRVQRGGGWNNHQNLVRSTHRTGDQPDEYYDNSGFRCIIPLDQ